MWKYPHSVKENPKSGYDWSETRQRQTAFCACQREHWECRRPCVQSGRQSKTRRSTREISHETGIHWLTVHRIIYRDLQLRQAHKMTSPSDSLQAAAEEVQRSCNRLQVVYYGWKSVYRRTTIQLSERPGLCDSRNQEATHRWQPSELRTRLTFSRRQVWLLEVKVTEGVRACTGTPFLSTCYEPVCQVLGLKELMCK